MADYDSALPIRGNVKDGASVDADNQGLVMMGNDGSNYQDLSVDSSGNLQVDVVAELPAGTQVIGEVKVTDGTDDLDIATDGSAAKTKGIQVLGTDGTNAQILKTDTSGALFVNTGGALSNSNTYASVNLVKDTPTTLVSLAGAAVVRKIVASGSGLMKVDVQYGTTASETTIAVLINSTANPNVELDFPHGLTVASGETILLECTNLEASGSPASDFSGYGTIMTEA